VAELTGLNVLVVNAGSSSLKVSLLDAEDRLLVDREVESNDEQAITAAMRDMERVDAVGHRVVHGGRRYQSPVRIDSEVIRYLESITDLAPLHLPAALAGIETVARALPDVPAVACFDTAFHSRMPPAASTYAIPKEWRDRYGIRRYGFHGFSHAYASRRAGEMLSHADLRVVTCHLGAGASLAAVRSGTSVDTTMGFTPLEGLVMATRSGDVDPGALLYLMRHAKMSEPTLTDGLDRRGGLAALAGTSDMREVLDRRAKRDPDATLAFDIYLHRLSAEIAAMAAAMGGVDAIVFTGGVGEHSAGVRAAVGEGLAFLGIRIEAELNHKVDGDADISSSGAPVRTLVVHAREDIEVARAVRQALDQGE
jgi:acetate kinase